jgi:hypothetical protein
MFRYGLNKQKGVHPDDSEDRKEVAVVGKGGGIVASYFENEEHARGHQGHETNIDSIKAARQEQKRCTGDDEIIVL